MLLAISLYRLPDFMRGPVTNPFFHDLGVAKDVIGTARATVGLAAIFAGSCGGRIFLPANGLYARPDVGRHYSVHRHLRLRPCSPMNHAMCRSFWRRWQLTISASVVAGVTLVAYMSSLTSLGYTATQYALLSSAFMPWLENSSRVFPGSSVEGFNPTFRADERLCPVFHRLRRDRGSLPGCFLPFWAVKQALVRLTVTMRCPRPGRLR